MNYLTKDLGLQRHQNRKLTKKIDNQLIKQVARKRATFKERFEIKGIESSEFMQIPKNSKMIASKAKTSKAKQKARQIARLNARQNVMDNIQQMPDVL